LLLRLPLIYASRRFYATPPLRRQLPPYAITARAQAGCGRSAAIAIIYYLPQDTYTLAAIIAAITPRHYHATPHDTLMPAT